MFTAKPIDKIIKNALDSFKFKCNTKGCGEHFFYQDAQKHKKKCESVPAVPCLLDCNDKTLIKGAEKMLDHLMKDCHNMKGNCSKCQEQFLRAEIGTHVCKQELLQENTILKAEITRLQKIIRERD